MWHNWDQRVRAHHMAKQNITEKHLHNSLLQLQSHRLNSSTESTVPYRHQLLPAHGVGSTKGKGQQTFPCEQPHRDASPPGSVFWVLPKVRQWQQHDLGLNQQGTATHFNIPSEFHTWPCYTNKRHINKHIFLNLSQLARYEIKSFQNLPNAQALPSKDFSKPMKIV